VGPIETYSLREDELFDVMGAARKRDARDHALLLVGYWHGLRNQEIARLRLQDIDWAAETIRVQRQIAKIAWDDIYSTSIDSIWNNKSKVRSSPRRRLDDKSFPSRSL
jgi:integrase